mmetsp:Transcript_39327/g.47651  ORF Transcript_39327/g.47651 Transcript_39327/m.47651 type:complete len:143 (-) Transcript_39327:363-791(-)|eukprot:CAMPEP_0197859774 /NCGR_PEP_ID=MMETSP1438-20131217/34646_1 /TAXON_ID=1461541 /ORGANISM="Pterosperma sp., Strain CCMP1384" /LENGTH=142 /DNA_ID=CAMNT_0043476409 /DNA_START=74 /DNA_END=502 /DNA_ORIENTATION=-
MACHMSSTRVHLSSSFTPSGIHSASRSQGLVGARAFKVNNGTKTVCRHKGIHPKFYDSAPVYCNGELVCYTSGTQPEYRVDIWSGTHPFYKGETGLMLTDVGRVNKFNARYGNMGLGKIPEGGEAPPDLTELKKKMKKSGKK